MPLRSSYRANVIHTYTHQGRKKNIQNKFSCTQYKRGNKENEEGERIRCERSRSLAVFLRASFSPPINYLHSRCSSGDEASLVHTESQDIVRELFGQNLQRAFITGEFAFAFLQAACRILLFFFLYFIFFFQSPGRCYAFMCVLRYEVARASAANMLSRSPYRYIVSLREIMFRVFSLCAHF